MRSALLLVTMGVCLPVLPVCGNRTRACGWPGFDLAAGRGGWLLATIREPDNRVHVSVFIFVVSAMDASH